MDTFPTVENIQLWYSSETYMLYWSHLGKITTSTFPETTVSQKFPVKLHLDNNAQEDMMVKMEEDNV